MVVGMSPDKISRKAVSATRGIAAGSPGRWVRSAGTVSVLQVVAHNLRTGRQIRKLTQEALGRVLTDITGTPWSRATVSAAENGWRGKKRRVRHFDAEELVAFAIALNLPLIWFFLPPLMKPNNTNAGEQEAWITVTKFQTDAGRTKAIATDRLKALITAYDDEEDPDVRRRLRAVHPEGSVDGEALLRELKQIVEEFGGGSTA